MKFANNKFTEDYQATIGVEFGAKNITIDDQIFRIQIWDTAGQENFRSITRAYYKNSVCAMLVYDITNRSSFENLQDWLKDIISQSPKTVLIILLGNKIDLKEKREVEFEEGEQFAQKNGLIFMETSAKTGEGVEEIFKKSVQEIKTKISENVYDLTSESCGIKKGKTNNISLNKNNKQNTKKKGCC